MVPAGGRQSPPNGIPPRYPSPGTIPIAYIHIYIHTYMHAYTYQPT